MAAANAYNVMQVPRLAFWIAGVRPRLSPESEEDLRDRREDAEAKVDGVHVCVVSAWSWTMHGAWIKPIPTLPWSAPSHWRMSTSWREKVRWRHLKKHELHVLQ